MRKLSVAERKQLHAALVNAFPDWNALALAMDLYLGENLNTISAPLPMPAVVLNLIVWGESRGRLAEVIAAARDANPGNPALAAFATTVLADQGAPSLRDPETARALEPLVRAADRTPGTAAPAGTTVAPAAPAREMLERITLASVEFFGADEWRARMRERERSVCRVEFPEGQGQGTGFLVGPDAVMTNYHVLADYIEGRQAPSTVACRFDYATDADGVTTHPGEVFTLAADWLVDRSAIDRLDFVIVRLAEPAGRRPARDQVAPATRGWLVPRPHPFVVGESIFIMQHPNTAPLKVASGGLVRAETTRLYYLANTLPGLSGSPCFTSNWDLVGLHRAGDALANAGVPLAAIVDSVTPETRAALFGGS